MNLKKTMFILPNLFTLSSVFCGMYAILAATGASAPNDYFTSAIAIVFAMFFDMVDGRVARLTKTQSEFGLQLDSLADMVSFGAAPAILMYSWGLSSLTIGTFEVGFFTSFVFVACGAIRLARFNVLAQQNSENSSGDFVGLPIPLAAGMLVAIVIANPSANTAAFHVPLAGLVGLVGLLMVSQIKFRAFKKIRPTKRVLLTVLTLGTAATVLAMQTRPSLALLTLFSMYVIFGLSEHVFGWLRGSVSNRKGDIDVEAIEDNLK